jgi:hypothetical protein
MWMDLITEPWFAITGWVLTALGVILSIALHYRAKVVISPVVHITVAAVIERRRAPRGVEVRFRDRAIDGDLHYAVVAFWNRGNRAIEEGDIVQREPLRIVARHDARILDARVVRQVGEECGFDVRMQDDGSVGLAFDCIRKGRGVLVGVLLESSLSPKAGEDALMWQRRLQTEVVLRGQFKNVDPVHYSAAKAHLVDGLLTLVLTPFFGPAEQTGDRTWSKPRKVLGAIFGVPLLFSLIPLMLVLNVGDWFRNRYHQGIDKPFI